MNKFNVPTQFLHTIHQFYVYFQIFYGHSNLRLLQLKIVFYSTDRVKCLFHFFVPFKFCFVDQVIACFWLSLFSILFRLCMDREYALDRLGSHNQRNNRSWQVFFSANQLRSIYSYVHLFPSSRNHLRINSSPMHKKYILYCPCYAQNIQCKYV